MLTWLDQRTGFVTMTKDFLTEDVPGGASYWYAFGSATVFAMILQIVTGIFLTFYYSPSASTAYESTKYLMDKVPMGHFVLSLHYWGASAMIAFMAMHLLQVLLWGAYKKPRELQWIVGVILFILTLVLGLTGYLLPWDLNALLASKVAIQVAGSVPMVGALTQTFLQDGADIGTLTINRFFGVHVWLTPAILVALVGAHLAIFRWNGPAGPPTDEAPKLKPGRFWPDQMFMDTVLSFVMFAIIVLLSFVSPAPLDEKADPNNTAFVPYPAWYFMALYAMLGIVGQVQNETLLAILDVVATVILPGGLVALLILLPFIDRNPSRRLSRRPWVLGLTAATMAGALALSIYGQVNVQTQQVLHGVSGAAAAATTNKNDVPPVETGAVAGGGAVAGNAAGGSNSGNTTVATGSGATVYTANCAGCHGAAGTGQPGVFPPLAKNPYVTGNVKAVIHTVNYGLSGPIVANGGKYNSQMPAWKGNLTDAQIADVINYVRNSWGNKGSLIKTSDVAAVKK
ncbi:MAG: cytochrome b N-terminal domain-containing protein [Candidatus Velthaea sp.]